LKNLEKEDAVAPSPPYLVLSEDSEGQELQGLLPQENVFQEEWLQELLYKHASLLPLQLLDEAFSPAIPIGREIDSIDNLFISSKGLLTIVETKLWRNPEAHRTVVAQILEYASRLATWDYRSLDDAVRAFTQRKHGQAKSLFTVVREHVGEWDREEIEFEQAVQDGLSNGHFALLIVGDRIFPGATQLANMIQSAPHLQFTLAFVELHCYRLNHDSGWPLIVVPHLVAKTKEIDRAVVKIVYEGKKPEVQVETPAGTDASKGFTSLSKFAASLPRAASEIFSAYIDKWMKTGYIVYWGTVGFSLRIIWNGKKTTIFEAYPTNARFFREDKARQLGFPDDVYSKYLGSLMESSSISGAIASGRTYLRIDNMSPDDVSLLLQSTDTLVQSLNALRTT
jgi:hypothetical protein